MTWLRSVGGRYYIGVDDYARRGSVHEYMDLKLREVVAGRTHEKKYARSAESLAESFNTN